MQTTFEFAIPRTSYSQAGEDVIVDFIFQQINIQPTYLELGTNHPRIGNNTYIFYRRGCSGVLVEADPSQIPDIRKVRRRDVVLNVGVSSGEETIMKFYVFSDPSINTFNATAAREREQSSTVKLQSVVDVQLMSINKIIENNFTSTPDFLSIDIEGLDLTVLQSLDFEKHPIPVICAETCLYSETHVREKDKSIEKYLVSKGYFVFADTYINTIFVNEKWFRQAGK
jgi:FkbM family methyltransferase